MSAFIPILAMFGVDDAIIYAVISLAATAAGTAISYTQSQAASRQAKLNAQAQANAQAMEQQRQLSEREAQQQATLMNQRRFRASQESNLAGSGFLATTGSALDIINETDQLQKREIQNIGYGTDVNNWQLQAARNATIDQGNSQASAIMGQAGGTLLSNIGTTAYMGGQVYKNYSSGGGYAIPMKSTSIRPASQRPSGY